MGKLVSKFGIKKLAIAASISPAIALIGMRFSGSIIIAYVFAIVSGLLVALSTTAVLNLYIGSWFNKGKGTMTSVGQTIATLFSIVFVPVVTSLLVAQGAEKASIFVGIIMLAVGIAGALFVKGMPSEYGVEPVDIVERKTTENDAAASTEIYDVQMPAVKLISKAPVAALLIMTFLTIVGLAMFGTYSVYIFDSYLNNMVTASFYVSITSACVLGFSMLFGMLCDKVGVSKTVILYGLLAGVSKIVGPVVGGTVGALIIAIFNGASMFGTMFIAVGFPLIIGYKNMATIVGWAGALMSAGGMVAPVLAMILASKQGSYDLVVIVCGILTLASMLLCVFSISRKARKSIKKADEAWIAANSKT